MGHVTKDRPGLPDKQMGKGSRMSVPNPHPHRNVFPAHINLFSVQGWCAWDSKEAKFRASILKICISPFPSLDCKGTERGEVSLSLNWWLAEEPTTEETGPWVGDRSLLCHSPVKSRNRDPCSRVVVSSQQLPHGFQSSETVNYRKLA